MSTYTQILYQVVFATKNRVPCLTKANRETLFMYISGVVKRKNCFLYIINGVEDHIHIVFSLHPAVALSELMKDIKVSSSLFIKKENLFPRFTGWGVGYGAFTYSIKSKLHLINYVKQQEEHHSKKESRAEFISMLQEHNIDYLDEYIE